MTHRWIRRAAWCLGGLLALWLLAWLVVPPVARAQIEKHASQALGRTVTVDKVEFLPWMLEATVRGLSIASQDGTTAQVQVARIHVDAELQSLWRLAPVIDSLQVDEPVIHVAQTEPGRYDFDDVLARFGPKPGQDEPPSSPQGFALYNIVLQGGAIDFDDRTVGKTHTLRQIRLDIPFLSNLPADREVKVLPRLAFALNGSHFDSAAQATPFADSRQTEARLKIDGFDLGPFGGYLPDSVPLRLKAGVLGADLRFSFEQAPQRQFKITGQVALNDVQTTDGAGAPFLEFDVLQVALKDVQPLQRRVELDSIDWRGARAHLRRDASGAVGLAQGGQTAAVPAASPGQAKASANESAKESQESPWQFRLGRLRLADSAVEWTDASLPGAAAAWKAEELQLEASAIALPFTQPLQFRASARLSGGGAKGDAARLAIQGQATDAVGRAAVSVRGLPVAMAAPYLASVLKPSVGGVLDADLGLARNGDAMAAKVAMLTLDKLTLECAAQAGCQTLRDAGVAQAGGNTLLEGGRLEVGNAMVLLPRRQVTLGRVSLQQPRVLLARAQDGAWMYEQWLARTGAAASAEVTAPVGRASAAPAQAARQQPWRLKLDTLDVQGASLAFRDAAAVRPVALNLTGLNARLQGVSLADGKMAPMAVQLDTRVGAGRVEPGRLIYEGTVAAADAMSVQGKIRAQHLPLHALEPYVAPSLNVDILRAEGSFAGDLRYVQPRQGDPLLSVGGNASLDEVRVRAAASEVVGRGQGRDGRRVAQPGEVGEAGEELLRWKSLALRGVALNMKPGQPLALDVAETALSDFFARIILQEDGRINLQSIGKTAAPEGAEGASAESPASTQAAASEAAPAAVAGAAPANPMEPVIRFGPVSLANGSIRFSDYFIKPNYSADLSELTGRLSAFSSTAPQAGAQPEMAELELRGRAQGTASLEVSGRLNPLVKPLALDIQGRMRDLELPPLTPYSVKYAGHGIERGKLNMDVSYKVLPSGQLTASNKLVLNQLVFGDPVEGAPASLPVRLAVALLADRNGVIDVDLPISGSLNDPEFRLGAVILKVIGNLVMKAITAPFSLLAGAFGGGDEEGVVAFAPGSPALDEKARQQLDKIAAELNNRPALKVTVVGWAQPQAEQEAWKRQRLQDMVQGYKRREVARAGDAAADVAPVSEAEYPALLAEVYRRADIKKPRNLVGMAKNLPQAEMEALLLDSLEVPDNAMPDLALARGVAVRDYLASRQVASDRLFVGASKLEPAGEAGAAWTPKAQLTLAAR